MKKTPDANDILRQHGVDALREHIDRANLFVIDGGKDGAPGKTEPGEGVSLDDFYAYMPMHSYIYAPTNEMWPLASVNARLPPMPVLDTDGKHQLDDKGEPKMISANQWLDQNQPVEQMTWAPGEPMLICDRLISEGGWKPRKKVTCFNQYQPPLIEHGDAAKAGLWLDHVAKVFGEDSEHIVPWLAHRVQRPQEKINHALVFGGNQGIGKDTLLEPIKRAVGPWNSWKFHPSTCWDGSMAFLKT
jgi:hypothetical protein